MSRQGPVLFVAYGSGHITKVAPVIRYLQAQGVPCELLALTIGYKQALQLGLSPKGYRDFLHLVDAETVLARGAALLNGNQHPDVDEFESCCYLGINYQEWVEDFGEVGARSRWQEGGRRAFLPVRFIGRVIDELRPSVVVSTSSPRSEQAAIEAAVARGIPCLTMMDLFALPYDPFLRQKVHADRITCMSSAVSANLQAAGLSAQRIRVTGCPAYDALLDPQHVQAGLALKRKLGWEGLRVVMWAGYMEEGPGVPEVYRGTAFGLEVERRLREWVARTSDAALIVRYHPNQFHYFPSLGQQPRVYLAQPADESVQPQLYASDAVVVQTSTVGLEAALIGKRVLALRFAPSVMSLGFDYFKLGLAEGVCAMDTLVSALEQPIHAERDSVVPLLPGLAAPRVAEEILKLRTEKADGPQG